MKSHQVKGHYLHKSKLQATPAPLVQKRQLLTEKPLVTYEQLQKTRFDLKNPEHSKLAFEILKKPHHRRLEEELQLLTEVFHDISFFQKMSTELDQDNFLELFRQLKAKRYKAGETLFNLGDWGEEFYIIIQGSVYILLKKQDPQNKKPNEPNTERKNDAKPAFVTKPQTKTQINSGVLPANSLKLDQKQVVIIDPNKNDGSITLDEIRDDSSLLFSEEATEEQKLENLRQKLPHLFVGRIMSEGEAFGEIALQNKYRRTATVVCREDTILGILSRQQYTKILYKLYEKRDEQDLQFLRGFSIFSHMTNDKLREIFLQLDKTEYSKNKCFYREGDTADRVYFIREGEVEISHMINQSELDKKKAESSLYSSQSKFRHKLFAGYHEPKPCIRLSLLSKGHYFGLEEVIGACPRKSSAKVVSATAEIYSMDKKKFRRIAVDKKLVERAKEDAKLRSEFQQMLISGVANRFHIEADHLSFKKQNNNISSTTKLGELSYRNAHADTSINIDLSFEKLPQISMTPVPGSMPNLDSTILSTSFNKQSHDLTARTNQKSPEKSGRNSITKDVLSEYRMLRGEEARQPKRHTSPRNKVLSSIRHDFEDKKHQPKEFISPVKEMVLKSIIESQIQSQNKELNHSYSLVDEFPSTSIFKRNSDLEKRKKIIRNLKFGDLETKKNSDFHGVSPKNDAQKFNVLCKVLKVNKIFKNNSRSFARLTTEEDSYKDQSSIGPEAASISEINRKESVKKIETPRVADKGSPHAVVGKIIHRFAPLQKGNLMIASPRSDIRVATKMPQMLEVKGRSKQHI